MSRDSVTSWGQFYVGCRVEAKEDVKYNTFTVVERGEQGEVRKLIVDCGQLTGIKVQFDDYSPARSMCIDDAMVSGMSHAYKSGLMMSDGHPVKITLSPGR